MTIRCFEGLPRRAVHDVRIAGDRVLAELEQLPPPWLVERLGGQATRDMFRSVRSLLRQAASSAPSVLRRDQHRVTAGCYDVALALRTAEDGVIEALLDDLRTGKAFDVIVCDLMMPQMTGMDLHATLAARAPDLARGMIFMTGGAFTPRARDFLGDVANRCLEKPFASRDLLTLIRAGARTRRDSVVA